MTNFDLRSLHRAVEVERVRKGSSWASVARASGVSASTIRRFADADDAEADGVLAVVRWLGVSPEDFIDGSVVAGQALSSPDDGFVRVDMELVASASRESAPSRARSRTTIQHLVRIAQDALCTVSSLTRVTDA